MTLLGLRAWVGFVWWVMVKYIDKSPKIKSLDEVKILSFKSWL